MRWPIELSDITRSQLRAPPHFRSGPRWSRRPVRAWRSTSPHPVAKGRSWGGGFLVLTSTLWVGTLVTFTAFAAPAFPTGQQPTGFTLSLASSADSRAPSSTVSIANGGGVHATGADHSSGPDDDGLFDGSFYSAVPASLTSATLTVAPGVVTGSSF